MEWAVVEEAAVAQLFGSPTWLESKSGSPSFGAVLFTYFLEYQTSDFKSTKASSNGFLDSIQSDNAHFHLIFAVTLFWLNLNRISLYHVLFCISAITTCLFIFVNYLAFIFLENDIKWIGRESRLLRAIVEDADGIESLSDQIRSKAHQVWDSELDTGVANVGLNEPEVAWVHKTRSVTSKAEKLVEDFENQKKREIILRKMSFSMLDFMEVEELFKRTRLVKDEINGSLVMKNVRNINICESLENSWSTIRKLLDRPIEEQENKLVKSRLQVGRGGFLSSLVEKVHSMVVLIGRIRGLDGGQSPLYLEIIGLQLLLLYPFLQHVEGLQLESEIGKAWLKEVDEIVGEAQLSIEAFSKATACQVWWLRGPHIIKRWKARRKLEADTKRIDVFFSELFQRKEGYGFKFIIRDSSKSSKYRNGDGEEKVLSVVKDIRYFLDQRRLQLGWVSGKLELLCDQLENMLKLLDDAETTYAGINSLRNAWFEQMKNVANIAAESKKAFWNNSPSVHGSYHRLRSTRARLQFSREIDQIKHRIHVIEKSLSAYSIELREESSSVVGLEEDVDALVSKLTAESRDGDCVCDVYSIVGMEGIGKTTLAKKVYGHRDVREGFPIRAWLKVPKKSDDELSFLEDVGKQVLGWHEKEINSKDEHNWKVMASDFLNMDKYLLVLDNVSTREAWDTLTKVLELKTSKGGRVVLTTQNEEVATLADQYSSRRLRHRIRLRTKDESLSLLKQMVYISSGEETIVEDIVRGCLGLPFSIMRVGYMMLKQEVTALEALVTVPLLKSALKETSEELPPHLKPLLEHFELFPRDFEIPARRLITLWVSEGLVKKSGYENQTLEQVADNYLSELIDQGIVQVVKRKANGKVKSCCLPLRSEPCFLQFSRESHQRVQHVRSVWRLAHHFNNKNRLSFCLIHSGPTHDQLVGRKLHFFFPYDPREDDEPGEDIGFFLRMGKELHDYGLTDDWISLEYKDLCSFLSFDTREGNEPGEQIGNFLSRGIARGFFQGLHVLDLERVFRPELPKNIGKLKKLRYLGLRWTYLQSIPSSIGELAHLETLDLKHTYVHTLPSSVWKLQRLRHLYLNQSNRSKFMRNPSGSSLKSLETLWGVFVDKNSPLMDCLDKVTNLRKLGLAFQLDKPEQIRLADRIMKLKRLQSLKLRSINERSKPGELFLKPSGIENLSGLENLSSLNLFGRLENPLVIDEFPEQLTELTLSASGLSNDTMSKLGKLRNLKLLCFYSNSYKGKQMDFSDEDFPQLLVLKLWKLEELEDLVFHEKALRNLRELETRSCRKLKVPYELKNLKSLLELKLTNMPEEFVREIDNNKGQIWKYATLSPSIKIVDNF